MGLGLKLRTYNRYKKKLYIFPYICIIFTYYKIKKNLCSSKINIKFKFKFSLKYLFEEDSYCTK